MIKPLLTAISLSLCLAGVAHAEDAKKAPTTQQNRMKDCNAKADGKKGDERKTFMSSCLSGKPAADTKAVTPQQQRMKDCNAKADGKKGDERKAFMSSCLKG